MLEELIIPGMELLHMTDGLMGIGRFRLVMDLNSEVEQGRILPGHGCRPQIFQTKIWPVSFDCFAWSLIGLTFIIQAGLTVM